MALSPAGPDAPGDEGAAARAWLQAARDATEVGEREQLAERILGLRRAWRVDADVARDAAEALFLVTVLLDDPRGCEELADRIQPLLDSHPGRESIAVEQAKALVNASSWAAGVRDRERLAERIDLLVAAFPRSERLAHLAAMARFNTSGDCEAGRNAAAAERISHLLQRFPDSEPIAVELSRTLYHSALGPEPAGRRRAVEQIEWLVDRFPASAAIAQRLLRAYAVLVEADGRSPSADRRLQTLRDRFADDPGVAAAGLRYLGALAALRAELLPPAVQAADELAQRFPAALDVALAAARIWRLDGGGDAGARWQVVRRIDSVRAGHPGDQQLAEDLARALAAVNVVESDMRRGQAVLDQLQDLRTRFEGSEAIALAWVQGMVHRMLGERRSGALVATVADIEREVDLRGRSPAFARELAKAQFHAARASTELQVRESAADELERLAARLPEEPVLKRLAFATAMLCIELQPDLEQRQRLLARIRRLARPSAPVLSLAERAVAADDQESRRDVLRPLFGSLPAPDDGVLDVG